MFAASVIFSLNWFVFFLSEHQFCGGKLTKSQGTIKTPNWPEKNYPPGISCSWLITVEPEMVRKKHNPAALTDHFELITQCSIVAAGQTVFVAYSFNDKKIGLLGNRDIWDCIWDTFKNLYKNFSQKAKSFSDVKLLSRSTL